MTRLTDGNLVFDAEALVAYFGDEAGAEVTHEALDRIGETPAEGFVSEVNATEVWYVIQRQTDAETANDHLGWLEHEASLRFVTTSDTWRIAATIKADHRVSLADAFALATAAAKGCPVLAGNDEEFDAGEAIGVEVFRIREVR